MHRSVPLLILVLILTAGASARAQDPVAPDLLIRDRIDSVIEVLQQQELDLQSKKAAILDLVEPLFDFALMGKLALGKTHWQSLSASEQERYQRCFVDMLKASYVNKLDFFSNESVVYRDVEQQGRNKVAVPTVLVSKDAEYLMLYKLYRSARGWLIYDVEIQGVSVITSFRSQFDQILQNGTPADLLREMAKQCSG